MKKLLISMLAAVGFVGSAHAVPIYDADASIVVTVISATGADVVITGAAGLPSDQNGAFANPDGTGSASASITQTIVPGTSAELLSEADGDLPGGGFPFSNARNTVAFDIINLDPTTGASVTFEWEFLISAVVMDVAMLDFAAAEVLVEARRTDTGFVGSPTILDFFVEAFPGNLEDILMENSDFTIELSTDQESASFFVRAEASGMLEKEPRDIPLPASLPLLVIGLAGIGLLRRRG